MKKYFRKFFLYICVFLIALMIMLGFLVLSAKVKRESIQENFEKSAEFLCEKSVFFYVEEDVNPSCIDRYADSILLNIAYNFEPDNSLESVMWSSYYFTMLQNENDNLLDAVKKGMQKNQQYLRYWHGSAGVIRLLHTFLDIKQIYIMHGVLLTILLGILVFILVRSKCIFEAIALVLSLIAVSVWYVPFSLEYTWVFICMFVFSIIAVMLVKKKKDRFLGIMFLISGMVTIFLDFLSTETLVFTVPMILVLAMRKHGYGDGGLPYISNKPEKKAASIKNDVSTKLYGTKEGLLYILQMIIPWGIGYLGMWVSKWMIASLVLGENVMPYVTEHIEERLSGDIGSVSILSYLWMALTRNLESLFPLDYGTGGVIIAGVILLVIAYFCFVYRKKTIRWGYIVWLMVIGLVPIVRFLVLRNHSALHYFFVHRALAGTMLALLISAGHIIDFEKIKKRHSAS